jgi:succinate dehydrogenase / fumarate reductase, membrane anchor subunit
MVTNVTSLTGNGLKDWLIQRVSAVYLAVFTLFVLCYLLTHPSLDYADWHALFACQSMKVASIVALFALSLHAWIGIWTVTTDYFKCTIFRISVQMVVVLWLLSQFVWGLMILWGQ